MARPRRGKSRQESDDYVLDYLATGERPTDPDHAFAVLSWGHDPVEVWHAHREAVMGCWDAPGCRPWGWWRWDAPRIPPGRWPGCFWDGTLPEPRRFIGGSGQPRHEAGNYAPESSFGLWAWEGGTEDDPPRFESQFGYLQRRGLLLPGEVQGPELQPLPASWRCE